MNDVVVGGREEAAAHFATPSDPAARAAERARTLGREGAIRGAVALTVAVVVFVLARPSRISGRSS